MSVNITRQVRRNSLMVLTYPRSQSVSSATMNVKGQERELDCNGRYIGQFRVRPRDTYVIIRYLQPRWRHMWGFGDEYALKGRRQMVAISTVPESRFRNFHTIGCMWV